VQLGDVLGSLALFADLDMPNLDRRDMTDAAIAAPASPEAVLSRIDGVLDEAWMSKPGVASMRPSRAPADENWRL
jgi:hypothetical protein